MVAARRCAQAAIAAVIDLLVAILVIAKPLTALPRLIAIDDIATAIAALGRRTIGPLIVAIIAVVAGIIPTAIVAAIAP